MTIKLASVVLLTASLALTGCGMYANIPDQSGDVASHNPNNGTVKKVMAIAAHAVVYQEPIAGTYNVVLPEGTLPMTYDELMPKIGPGAVWTSGGNTPEPPIVAVREVRIRGARAEVDVQRPAFSDEPRGLPMLVTAHLKLDLFGGWTVDKLRLWRAGVTPDAAPLPD